MDCCTFLFSSFEPVQLSKMLQPMLVFEETNPGSQCLQYDAEGFASSQVGNKWYRRALILAQNCFNMTCVTMKYVSLLEVNSMRASAIFKGKDKIHPAIWIHRERLRPVIS